MRIRTDAVDSDPRYYAYEGNLLMIYPTPQSSDDEIHIVYVPRPTAMTATTDSPSTVPEEYHPVIEAYVKWKAGEHANDKSSGNGQGFKLQYEEGVIDARVSQARRAGMRIGRVSFGQPSWRSYASPGVDVG
jgi:hypothetical protein